MIPNAERAVIATEKADRLLAESVPGSAVPAKARLLLSLGYRTVAPEVLEVDLRTQHLALDVTRTSADDDGVVYEIEGPITTPGGRIARFCSIWQIDTGSEVPRFITM